MPLVVNTKYTVLEETEAREMKIATFFIENQSLIALKPVLNGFQILRISVQSTQSLHTQEFSVISFWSENPTVRNFCI